jgi:hypothetical protein
VPKALCPALPHQTGDSVFSNPAFRSSSFKGFRILGPWSRCWNPIKLKSLIKKHHGSGFFSALHIVVQAFRQKFRTLLSLSKKSQWPISIILAPLKIKNLQATESRKMLTFRVFRQPRYLPANWLAPEVAI